MSCHPQQFQYEATTCVVTHHGSLPFTGMNLVVFVVVATLLIVAGSSLIRYARA